MTRQEPLHPVKRVRASENAIRAALKAIQDTGLPVEKVCVTGGMVEIHCAPIEIAGSREKDGGLKDW
jgi:hypothetical protein